MTISPIDSGKSQTGQLTRGRRPPWLRVRMADSDGYRRIKQMMRGHSLHTVCEEAMCPNIGECWERGTATFLLMGETCTRSCGFCKIKTGRPASLDEGEPWRVAETVQMMGLRHAVLTSVNRDELPDGGAHVFAETLRQIRKMQPGCTVEVLIPDFQGNWEALQLVMDERPEILNHNVETVPPLYRRVRPQARYTQSLELLCQARQMVSDGITKTGIMLGLGETREEVLQVMDDLRAADVDIMTIGQYLQPSKWHLPIERYASPEEFEQLRDEGMARGFKWVESGPLVRSSYHADGQVDQLAVQPVS
ncbi:MAG: lipoyl synthase [Chloroflexota bacterium]|nr:lipoyl synthase [Chloroflexota bacterium]